MAKELGDLGEMAFTALRVHGGNIDAAVRDLDETIRAYKGSGLSPTRSIDAREELLALKRGRKSNPPRRSNPKVTTFRANPSRRRASFILSTTALDLSYLHSEKKRAPYRHKFDKGVSIELMADGTIRLFRPDGRPLWKNFKDR